MKTLRYLNSLWIFVFAGSALLDLKIQYMRKLNQNSVSIVVVAVVGFMSLISPCLFLETLCHLFLQQPSNMHSQQSRHPYSTHHHHPAFASRPSAHVFASECVCDPSNDERQTLPGFLP